MKNTHQQAPHTCGHQAIYADTQKIEPALYRHA